MFAYIRKIFLILNSFKKFPSKNNNVVGYVSLLWRDCYITDAQ